MNYFSAFLAFMGLALLSFFNCRNSAIGIMSEEGFNQRYYPKHYITPHRWMKKFYKFKQSSIPKYVFLEFYLAIIFALLGPVNFLIFIFTSGNSKTVGILVMLHCCLIILNTVIFVVMSHCFKKNSKKKKDSIKNKSILLLLLFIILSLIFVLYSNIESKKFDSIEETFRYHNECELSLAVEGEHSVLALGINDGTIVRDVIYKDENGYYTVSGLDTENTFCSSDDGFSCDLLHVKKTDEYYIRVYSSDGEISQISDSCNSAFYSLQPYSSDITEARMYYAYIHDFNDNYCVKLNDKLIDIKD